MDSLFIDVSLSSKIHLGVNTTKLVPDIPLQKLLWEICRNTDTLSLLTDGETISVGEFELTLQDSEMIEVQSENQSFNLCWSDLLNLTERIVLVTAQTVSVGENLEVKIVGYRNNESSLEQTGITVV